jgi:hypothetical protein
MGELFRNVDRAAGPRASLSAPESAVANSALISVRPSGRRTALP